MNVDNRNQSVKEISQIVDYLIKKLSATGFTIHRYDAYTSHSVYLKLDYGVCNSIRISDHQGKQHLKYRYNLILNGKVNIVKEKYIRYFFNKDNINDLLNQILSDKQCKVSNYGNVAYQNFMVQNGRDHKNQKGFWTKATLVAGTNLT